MTLTRQRKKKKDRTGFTLIELMIAVVILGILAAVAIPAFLGRIQKAKASEAALNLKNLSESCAFFYFNNHYLPTPTDYTPAAPPGPSKYNLKSVIDEFTDPASAHGPSWIAIGWLPSQDFYFAYMMTHNCGNTTCPSGTGVLEVHARGDLDGDGTTSHYYRKSRFLQSQFMFGSLISEDPLE